MIRTPMIMFCSIAIIATLMTSIALWPSGSHRGMEAQAHVAPATKQTQLKVPPLKMAPGPVSIASEDIQDTPSASRPFPSISRSARGNGSYSTRARPLTKRLDAAPLAPPLVVLAPSPEPLSIEKVQSAPNSVRKAFDPPSSAPARSPETISSSDREITEPRDEKLVSRGEEARDAMRDIRPR